jgi:NodT family efflux transporter outer membrane factor (OMF) lipoprotein
VPTNRSTDSSKAPIGGLSPSSCLIGTGIYSCFLLLSGCAVGPDFVSPPSPEVERYTPEKIAHAGDKAAGVSLASGSDVPQRWWETFKSRKLNRLIEASIEHNPSIQAAEAAIQVSYYAAEAQKGGFLPSVFLNSSDSVNLPSNLRPLSAINQTMFAQTYPSPFNVINNAPLLNIAQNPPMWSYSLFLKQATVAYTLDIWGQNRRTVEVLEAQTDTMRYQSEAAYLALTANVTVAAIQEAALRGQLAAIERVIKIERELLDLFRNQKGVGWASEADVLTQEAALAQALELLPPLKKQVAQQRNLLTALAGRYSSDEITDTFDLDDIKLPRVVPLTLPARFVRQRPDIRAAEAQLHMASAQVGVTVAARLPNISLSANGGVGAYKLAQLIMPGTHLYGVAADVTQPIFSGFSLLNQQKGAEAAFQQAEAQYRQTIVTAFENVADLLRAIQADSEAVKAAAYAERVSGKNLDIVRGQLKVGTVSVLAVLNAQQTYLLAVVAHAQARGNLLADVAGLFMALGGGWQDQNLKDLPPDGPDGPTKQQVEQIRSPVNPGLLPDQISNLVPISSHPER